LGEAYYRDRQYDQAISWLGRIPLNQSYAEEANFYLGLAAYFKADYGRAESAFTFVAGRLPLAEIYNNLGVVASRRGQQNAAEYFQKALNSDPNDADYHFNLALALYREKDFAGSSRQIRQTLAEHPTDGEASSLLQMTTSAESAKQGSKVAAERIRTNYSESSFRELAIEIDAAVEQRLSKTDPRTHARYHAERGHELLNQGFVAEAEKEFRESITLDATNPFAHAGLARVLEANNDFAGARSEAQEALRQRQFADPLLVLARLELSQNNTEVATEDVDQALRLEPSNVTAQALKHTLAAKLAQKAQPLPKP
jgi:tetratricopeptide (TPR) repeat protein